jgi:hypothetical protein
MEFINNAMAIYNEERRPVAGSNQLGNSVPAARHRISSRILAATTTLLPSAGSFRSSSSGR